MALTLYPAKPIEWSPIIAGSILSCAASILLIQFGQALGLSFTDLYARETITPESFLVFGIWTLWIQVSATILGAYLAGRLTTPWADDHEGELRDGAHGLLVWALSTVLTAIAIGVVGALSVLAVHHGVEPKTTISDVMAKRITVIGGFSLAATSLVSAVSGWIAAVHAGDHRDRKVDVRKQTTFRRVVAKAKAKAR